MAFEGVLSGFFVSHTVLAQFFQLRLTLGQEVLFGDHKLHLRPRPIIYYPDKVY